MGKSKRLAAPREENFQTYEKDNNTNKKMYLPRSIQNVNKTAAICFQLQSGIQLTEQQLSLYKLHQRQLKMKKIKPKNKTKRKQTNKQTNYCPHI